MTIKELKIKGFKSFGNNEQSLTLNTDKGDLILITGENGSGKCVRYNTHIGSVFINKILITTGFDDYARESTLGSKIAIDMAGKRFPKSYDMTIGELYELAQHINMSLSKIEINTPNGYKRVLGIDITAKDSIIYQIKTDKGHLLECSPDHKILQFSNWKKAKELSKGDTISCKEGLSIITDINVLEEREDLYDLEVIEHEYFTNGIISHNSSLLSAVEYVLYGKVRGKNKKWTTLSSLPNRINGSMLNSITFESGGTEVKICRGESPKVIELYENGILNERFGKANIDTKIEEYIGMDVDTFKSFISMSINDFKNFISLSNEEKQLLLDKLFNLEIINSLNNVLKEMNKNNKIRMTSLSTEISSLTDSITSIHNSIEAFIEKEKQRKQAEKAVDIEKEKEKIRDRQKDLKTQKDDYTTKIEEMVAVGKEKAVLYNKLKDNITKIKNKMVEVDGELDSDRAEYSKIKNEISNVDKEINLYDKGKCPTCGTDFHSEHFINLKAELNEKKESFIKIKTEIEEKGKKVKEYKNKLMDLLEKANTEYNNLVVLIKGYKSKIEDYKNNILKIDGDVSKLDKMISDLDIQKEIEPPKEAINIDDFKKTISDLEEKKNAANNKLGECKDTEIVYKELNKIFSEGGVKKSIISNIIKPINKFITENMHLMNIPYDIKLDDTFNATITQFGNQIEYESLSTGETKKINIAIVLAYLKLIRTKKHINILFLDEVFAGLDLDGIDAILTLLKSFANEYKINIFVVHHAILNQDMFDRIIKMNKDVFTTIEEIK